MECWTCKSNSGEKRISPGPTISEGQYWLVEHAYPVKTIGWLVIVLKRHAEALHELTTEEFTELAQIQARLTKVLFEELHCEKEYISCYTEAEHFYHIHFHVFAKPPDLPDELKGGKSFSLLKVTNEEAVSPNKIIAFCELLKNRFK
jgi:Diadenosine tetraphosphate (Ap4A) hydrolase and other HIT family hydrolases